MKSKSHIRDEWRFLFQTVSPYKKTIFLFLVASLLASLFDGISIGLLIPVVGIWQGESAVSELPRFLRGFIDLLQSHNPVTQIILSILIVIVAIIIKNVLVGFSFRLGLYLSNRINVDIRTQVLKILMTVGIDYHHKSRIGELIDKTIGHTQLLRELITAIIEFIVFSLTFIILFLLMLMISWQLTLYATVLGFTFTFLLSLYLKGLTKYGKRSSETSRALNSAIHENLSAVHLIQSYNKQDQQISKLYEKIEDHAKADMRSSFRLYWVQPITEGMGVIAIGVLLIVSLILLPSNMRMNLAQLLPFLYILLRNVQTLRLLNSIRGVILYRWPYLHQVYDLIREDNKPFIPDGDMVCPGFGESIIFEHVTFAYEDGIDILRDISFDIPHGKTTAIVGESGVGKSTIVNLLMRFYDPQKGEVLMDGQTIRNFKVSTYRHKIGVVSQDTFIFNDSVRFNIGFSLDEDVPESQLFNAARKAGAHDFISEMPDGYDSLLGDRGVKLSGGQRQRIAIARAILKDPEILILDEATSSLDTITEQMIHDTLTELGRDRTVIIIAHRLSTVQNADKIIVLKDGRVAEAGIPETLIKRKGEYYALMKAQSKKAEE